MKKLATIVAALALMTGVAFAGGPTTGNWGPVTWAHSNPGFTTIINQQAVKSIQVKSWTTKSGKAAWGGVIAPQVRSTYSSKFTGNSGVASGYTQITRTPGKLSVTSSASAYSTTK